MTLKVVAILSSEYLHSENNINLDRFFIPFAHFCGATSEQGLRKGFACDYEPLRFYSNSS
jgi:hypothetical protein